jgi:hypothetical protein
MAGYAAAARIERAMVHPMRPAELWADRPTEIVDEVVEPDGPGTLRPRGPGPAERWGRFREACGQLTWYLLDPQGWR